MVVRRNKPQLQSSIPVSKPFSNRGQATPLQDRISEQIGKGNDTVAKLYKVIPDTDPAHIRRAIRNMVEGHKIVQRFSLK